GDDDILQPVDDEGVALVVHRRDVAGMEAAAEHGELGLLGLLPIAGHYLRPADTDLTRLAGLHRRDPVFHGDDLDDGLRRRYADRARLADAVRRVAAGDRRGLRQAIAFQQLAAG